MQRFLITIVMQQRRRFVVAMMFLAAAMNSHAQPAYKCYSSDGKSSWSQDRPCSFASPDPHGDALYKCVSPKGAVSIQQEPCTGKDKTAWRRDAPPEYVSPDEQARHNQESLQHDQDARELSHRAGTDLQQNHVTTYQQSDRRSIQQSACQQARSNRDAVLKQVGLHRTYDLLRTLNDAVFEACHGL